MEEITDLMRIKYGISRAPKSLTFKPDDSIHAQWLKTAKWLAKTGLSNGDYGPKDEIEAAQHYFTNYVNEKDAKITLTPIKFSEPTKHFLQRQFDLKEGKDGSSALNGHVYFVRQHLELVNRDVHRLVLIDPTNHSLTQHGHSVSFVNGTPTLVAEDLKKQGVSAEETKDLPFNVFNQDILIGYDKLRVNAEKEILPKLEGREKAKTEDMLDKLSNVGYRRKHWQDAFTISTERQDAVENGRKMSREEADQNYKARFYSDDALKSGWYNPETGKFYFNEKRLREAAEREKEENKVLGHFQNYLWNTYDISVAMENEEAEKTAIKKHARFFEEKKNIPPKTRQKMEELSKMLGSHFKGVELDEDTDLEKIDKLAPEIKAIADQLPLAENGEKPILRFRKLGTTALGKFTKANNTIAVDIRDFGNGNVGIQSFLHEYGHYLDQNQNGLPLSLQADFRKFSQPAQQEIMRNPANDRKAVKYLTTPSEIFARGFEKSLAQYGVKGNFIDTAENYNASSHYNYGDKVNEMQLDYFKSKGIEDLAKKIKQAVESLDQKKEEKSQKREEQKENQSEQPLPTHFVQLELDLFSDEQNKVKEAADKAKQEKLDTDKWREIDMKERWSDEKLQSLRESDKPEDRRLLAEHCSEEELDKLVGDPDENVRYTVAWRGRPKDLERLVHDDDMIVRQAVAAKGRDQELDKLVSDPEDFIRGAVALRGRDKDLDKLVSDESPWVRKAVATQGRDKDLDRLVNDKNTDVRVKVAKQGRDKDLDKLVNDKDWFVRAAVAKQSRDKDLDQLVSDKAWEVRSAVASQGRDQDLDQLVNDKDYDVQSTATQIVYNRDLSNLRQMQEQFAENYLYLKDIGAVDGEHDTDDPSKLAKKLPEWRKNAKDSNQARVKLATFGRDYDLDKVAAMSNNPWQVREAVAMRGRDKDLDKLVDDRSASVRMAVARQGRDKDLDHLVSDLNEYVRWTVADQGRDQDLDKLANDKDWHVRMAVARQGRDQDLDQLVSDKNEWVRYEVAMQGRDKDLDHLVSDKDLLVRSAVAGQGRDKDLNQLVNDKDLFVRTAVAGHGRDQDLDKLAHDKEWFVRYAVDQKRENQADPAILAKRREVARRGLER